MGVFDLKQATVTLCDGRKAAETTGGAANAQLTFTDASTHRGTQAAIRVAIINAGASHLTLDVAVSGSDITITPITDGGSAITSTAAAVKAAVDAFAAAAALVTTTLPGTGGTAVVAQAFTALTSGPRTLVIKIAEGTISYTEKKNLQYTKDKGVLSVTRLGDQEPMDVKLDAIWEHIKASTGSGTPTPEDVLKNRGEAVAWVTTDPDACQPFCVDVEILDGRTCGSSQREWITLPLFRYESIDHDAKNGTLMFSGKCNATQATVLRAT